jgi:hypothetical protein
VNDEQIRRFFDTQLAGHAQAIQRDTKRTTRGLRRLVRPPQSAIQQLQARFDAELARPAVEQLRPGWMYHTESSLTEDELFASRLFHRIPLRRFVASPRVRGRAHDLPFEMHEVIATGDGPTSRFLRILLSGFLAHVGLPEALPGHVRFCRHLSDKTWRRPEMDGYRSIDVPSLSGHYTVDATPDAVSVAGLPGLIAALEDLAKRGWLVHVAFGGLSAWVAIERSRTWFEPRVLPPYSADDLLELDHAFAVIELIASQLHVTMPAMR